MTEVMIRWDDKLLIAKLDTQYDPPRSFIPVGSGNCYEEIKHSQYLDAREAYLGSGGYSWN